MKTPSRIIAGLAATAALAAGMALPANAADTTTTAELPAGTLSISAPENFALGRIVPGAVTTSVLKGVTVTDNRAGTTGWDATVNIESLTGKGDHRLSADNITYTPVTKSQSGSVGLNAPVRAERFASALRSEQTVQSAYYVKGNNKVTWDATIEVTAPSDALADNYTGVIVHSVY